MGVPAGARRSSHREGGPQGGLQVLLLLLRQGSHLCTRSAFTTPSLRRKEAGLSSKKEEDILEEEEEEQTREPGLWLQVEQLSSPSTPPPAPREVPEGRRETCGLNIVDRLRMRRCELLLLEPTRGLVRHVEVRADISWSPSELTAQLVGCCTAALAQEWATDWIGPSLKRQRTPWSQKGRQAAFHGS